MTATKVNCMPPNGLDGMDLDAPIVEKMPMPAATSNIKPALIHIRTDKNRTQGFVPASWAMVLGETASAAPPEVEPYKLAAGVE